ncbi:aminoglycoside phosphotransferase family protein [Tropicimonas marinistellae]|uniref:aminoglycoside phosphotransferase family protein n=1 Tax=Tropicimonas marinistellae TaxID=1739787 RepID=UPI00082C2583|nr:aminoglycoside phosphotransferase family protein [Tropicimonas marinistellae]
MGSLPSAVEENLHFLTAEVDGQLASLQSYFDAPSEEAAQKVIQRAGYSFNLRSRVEKACQRGLGRKNASSTNRLTLQSLDVVARSLDQTSRHARRCLIHCQEVRRPELLRPEAYPKTIKAIRAAVQDVPRAVSTRDSRRAVRIGQTRGRTETLYDQLFRTYTRDMRKSKRTEDLANALLAASELRLMGDALQTVSEAILSVSIGQPVQFERYFTLRSILSDGDSLGEKLELEPLAETRSGSAISGVHSKKGNGDTPAAVFKDGEARKVRDERAGVKSWHSIYPGLAPKILSYEKRGGSAAMLIEHLPGQTFEHILLNESEARLQAAQKALSKTLRDIWRSTRTDEPAKMRSMQQLASRMKEVHRVHPDLAAGGSCLGGLEIAGFDDLLAQATEREAALPAPFSVYIHGDFNLDNIIYDRPEDKIRFIDLHRSRYMDYVQDVSVFMVSTYRLQIPDMPIRRRITRVACDFHAMAAKFARGQKDGMFEYRLALGLARSFATSTRFVFDKDHARRMFLRARFLLERTLECPKGKENRLKLPIEELFS